MTAYNVEMNVSVIVDEETTKAARAKARAKAKKAGLRIEDIDVEELETV